MSKDERLPARPADDAERERRDSAPALLGPIAALLIDVQLGRGGSAESVALAGALLARLGV